MKLEVDSEIAFRRVSLFGQRRNLEPTLRAVAFAVNAQLFVEPDGRMRIGQSEALRRAEKSRVAAAEQADMRDRNARVQSLVAAMERAAGVHGPDRPWMAHLLAGLAPDEVRELARAAAEPQGIIPAGNQTHYQRRMRYSVPYASLPALQKTAIEGAGPGAILSDSAVVGFVAADGEVRLGVFDPSSGRLWVAPSGEIRRDPVPDSDSDDDTPLPVADALLSTRLVDLAGMPGSIRNARIRFDAGEPRKDLRYLLERISVQSGLTIVADDWLRSTTQPYPWLLTDKPEYRLPEALEQIGRAFGHRFVYRDGILRVATITLGYDLLHEPPGEFVHRIRSTSRKRPVLSVNDSLDLSRLTDLQYWTFRLSHLSSEARALATWQAEALRPVIALYASLSPEQQRLAESDAGLPYSRLTPKQRAAAASALARGIPVKPSNESDDSASQFSTRVRTDVVRDRRKEIRLTLTSPHPPGRSYEYRLVFDDSD